MKLSIAEHASAIFRPSGKFLILEQNVESSQLAMMETLYRPSKRTPSPGRTAMNVLYYAQAEQYTARATLHEGISMS